jgi:Flp pilus assembly protein TadG
MTWRSLLRLRRDACGTTSLEFGLIAAVFTLLFMGTLELGLLLWTQNSLQMTAALTARCVALGAPACSTPATFAVNTASSWLFSGSVNSTNVWVQKNATCASRQGTVASGKFTVVTITMPFWGTGMLPPPFASKTLNATACFPTAA